ncbi:MAG: hypothetical protein B6I20_06890 [Bacteroidetes bacterium 4572_117]|nr:MAG: hypothetical protein B6I20_06890 [Bacteroidetes bacterium 4572_117]
MSKITINKLKIYYEIKGNGNKTIVFIHGNSLSSNLFNNQFKDNKLLNSYKLIRFDLPGFGKSEFASDTKTYSLPSFAEVFVELYKQLEISNAVLVGNSMGGHIILEALDSLPDVKGVLINGAPPFGLPPADDLFLPNPGVPLFFKGKHTAEELDILAKSMLKDVKFTEQVKDEIKKSDPAFRDAWLPNSQTIIPKDEIEIVRNTNIPMAVVHGNNDELVNFDYLKKLPFKTLWENKIFVIPEAGHLPFLEQPEIYNRYLLDFCEQVMI